MCFDHWPKTLSRPMADMLEALDQSLASLEAGSLMFWYWPSSEDWLLSIYNPSHPQFCGFQQPLSHGTISQVALIGLPILAQDLKERSDHDSTFDQVHQRSSRSMIAAPVFSEDEILGVLSAVQFDDTEQVNEFQLFHLNSLSRLAARLGS